MTTTPRTLTVVSELDIRIDGLADGPRSGWALQGQVLENMHTPGSFRLTPDAARRVRDAAAEARGGKPVQITLDRSDLCLTRAPRVLRTYRVEAALITTAAAKAAAEGRTVSDVLREALQAYVSRPPLTW